MGKLLARSFPSILLGPWIEFEDLKGLGKAQPDFVIPLEGITVVGEIKLHDGLPAEEELLTLYGPLAEKVWGPVVLVQVFKWCGETDLAKLVPENVCELAPGSIRKVQFLV